MRHLLWLAVDFVHSLFAVPHDWRIVEEPAMFVLNRVAPRTAEYYGNPLCYAYCTRIANAFYRLEDRIAGMAD